MRRGLWLCRAPLLAAAAAICLLSGFNLFRLMTAAAPRNPWEAIEIVEAWRSLQGMPVYELSRDGHATHMYGALVPWLQGEIFRWIGPNNVSGRALSLVSALLTVTVIALCMKNGRSLWYLVIGWAAILGVNHRSGHYFAENRPDMPALLFATLAMVLFWCGQERRRGLLFVLGIGMPGHRFLHQANGGDLLRSCPWSSSCSCGGGPDGPRSVSHCFRWRSRRQRS